MAETRNKLCVIAIMLARRWTGGAVATGDGRDRLREWVDGSTSSEQDAQTLDILTDLVMSNINRRAASTGLDHG